MLVSHGSRRWLACSAIAAGALAPQTACEAEADDPEPPRCIDIDPGGCSPLYAPTFDDVFTRTLMPSCATGGGSCHGGASALGAAARGFFVDTPDATFARLLEDRGDATFAVPGDAACSLLVVRLAVADDRLSMPPGAPLADGEVCSVAQWIENGAAR